MTLNVLRACQAAIDLALHVVSSLRLGLPQSSAEAFVLLASEGLIDGGLAASLGAMASFRNIAIHEYQAVSLEVLRVIVTERWRDLARFRAALGLRVEA
jgi:uncharacterized protein YutE (UPF0331/DUF86 family)